VYHDASAWAFAGNNRFGCAGIYVYGPCTGGGLGILRGRENRDAGIQ